MTMFVGDNPVILTGTVVTRCKEKVVLGDGRGNTLTFDWTDAPEIRAHGSPSDMIVDLSMDAALAPSASAIQLHIEGKAVQLRYAIEPVGQDYCVISYTLFEDINELLLEAEAPGLAHMDASNGVRMGMGPDDR